MRLFRQDILQGHDDTMLEVRRVKGQKLMSLRQRLKSGMEEGPGWLHQRPLLQAYRYQILLVSHVAVPLCVCVLIFPCTEASKISDLILTRLPH